MKFYKNKILETNKNILNIIIFGFVPLLREALVSNLGMYGMS